jgi:zinc protease
MMPSPVLIESNAALPLVHFSVSCLTGALEDPMGREGATRLMTRLLRRTAGGKTADEIDTTLDCMGATLGADVSCSTASISGTVITRNLTPFLALVKQVLGEPSLSVDEFERLRRETRAEIDDSLDNDRAVARRWFRRTFFAGHAYGRSVTGTKASLDLIEPGDARRQWQTCWVRNNVVFGFAGDISDGAAERATEELLTALPDGPRRADLTPEPERTPGRHLLIVDKPERTQTQILIGTLGSSAQDEDHTALSVANTVFGGTFTSRLTQEVRAKRGWSYGAYSSLPYDRQRHAFSLWTFPKASDAAACVALELELLEAWARDGITEEELGWAKSYLIKSHAFSIDTAQKRVGLRLDERIYDLPTGYFDEYVRRVEDVTLDAANRAIQRRINPEHLLVTVVGTEAEIGDQVRQAIPRLADSRSVAFDAE